eukprot:4438650-Ditylum_brightwellii.AAC.1
MERAEGLGGIALEQFGSRKHKSADLQGQNTCLLYNFVWLERTTSTSTFIDLVSSHNLVVHKYGSYLLHSFQQLKINRLPIDMTSRVLGIWMAPDDNSKKQ